jgi:hypothetical protein
VPNQRVRATVRRRPVPWATRGPVEGEVVIENASAPAATDLGAALRLLFDIAARADPGDVLGVVQSTSQLLGAQQARLYIADYALLCLQQVDASGLVGDPLPIEGTLAGHSFATGQVESGGTDPTTMWIPLTDGAERLGMLELEFDGSVTELPPGADPIVTALVMILVTKRRYTDVWNRTRRAQPLSAAAEAQWDLLPPLSCTTEKVAVSGILEPAYSIGGDSFDYAVSSQRLDFAIIDAIGHGMSSVIMSSVAINSLRNVRREGGSLIDSYRQTDDLLAQHFGDSYYVTGQLGSLDLHSGELTWLNAGHVPPMLVRNGTYAGELQCTPSMPIGLGGPVVQVATTPLQRGDRVLFYTDGITESQAPDGTFFGSERLADFLVRATLDQVSVAETVRRLSANVVSYVGKGLKDDATLFLIEYCGAA